jgi:pyruvate/2-oxoglutarate/acetoin dehydrogenase E1 component
LGKTLAAAQELASEGVAAEVLDLRTLRPLDLTALISSVRKTGRAVVIDEGWRTAGLAAEVSALITEHAFEQLQAPVARVCTAEVPIPYAKQLEDAALPQVGSIVNAARRVLERA